MLNCKMTPKDCSEKSVSRDVFGFIAFGPDELYHRGVVFSVLRILAHSSEARINILTDRPELFRAYPVEIIDLTIQQMREWSFDGRYPFGIEAVGVIELLNRADRLLFMDTDIYATGDLRRGFASISPKQSILRYCEGAAPSSYRLLAGVGLKVGDQVISGNEPMWNSGFMGVHHANIPALQAAFKAVEPMLNLVIPHIQEQFCVGLALSQDGRRIIPARVPCRHYNTSGKKAFARMRLGQFFSQFGDAGVDTQIEAAKRFRLWRTPSDLFRQKILRRSLHA